MTWNSARYNDDDDDDDDEIENFDDAKLNFYFMMTQTKENTSATTIFIFFSEKF